QPGGSRGGGLDGRGVAFGVHLGDAQLPAGEVDRRAAGARSGRRWGRSGRRRAARVAATGGEGAPEDERGRGDEETGSEPAFRGSPEIARGHPADGSGRAGIATPPLTGASADPHEVRIVGAGPALRLLCGGGRGGVGRGGLGCGGWGSWAVGAGAVGRGGGRAAAP